MSQELTAEPSEHRCSYSFTHLIIPVPAPPHAFTPTCICCLAAPGLTDTDSFPKMSPLFLIGFQSAVRQIRLLSGRQAPCWHCDARNDGSRSSQKLEWETTHTLRAADHLSSGNSLHGVCVSAGLDWYSLSVEDTLTHVLVQFCCVLTGKSFCELLWMV